MGGVEAVEMEIEANVEDCLKNLKVTSEVHGGAYYAKVGYQGRCEVVLPGADKVVYSDGATATYPNQVMFGASAKHYYFSVGFELTGLNPSETEKRNKAMGLILKSAKTQNYTVKALRATH